MKTKVLCMDIVAVPESKVEGARVYYDAKFKRVGLTGAQDEETIRVVKEHAHVHFSIGTWEPNQFEKGKEYVLEITPYPPKVET